jgi:hypothetical protein
MGWGTRSVNWPGAGALHRLLLLSRSRTGVQVHPYASPENLQRASARRAPPPPLVPKGAGAGGTAAWLAQEGSARERSHRLSDGYLTRHLPRWVSRDPWPWAINPQTPTLLGRQWWPDLGTAVTECRLPPASTGSYQSRPRGYRDSGPRLTGSSCHAGREGT